MPKELTFSDDPAFLQMPDGNEYLEGDLKTPYDAAEKGGKWKQRGIHVGWVKDKYVEVGAAAFDVSREMPTDGVFMSLDRAGINRLIRSLRRARDQAYGKDE